MNKWKTEGLDNGDAYHLLYKSIKDFDKHIARRYDDRRGSDYIYIVAAQLREDFISEVDIENFSDQVKEEIKLIVKRWNENQEG